jgi:undecaprenyl-diphosphatase
VSKAQASASPANIWHRSTKWLSGLERRELGWLLVGLGGCILLLVFLILAGEVMEGETLAFDKKIVLAFRQTADPAQPIGPARCSI